MKEKFLLDANSIITPYQNYYPFDFAPGYWKQFGISLSKDNTAVLDLVKNELEKGNDDLTKWFLSMEGLTVLDRRDQEIIAKYSEILTFMQESPLFSEKALRRWSEASVADPWLIATASVKGYSLVTFEKKVGSLNPNNPCAKPKIPDVAQEFGVKCVDLYYYMRQMNIMWK